MPAIRSAILAGAAAGNYKIPSGSHYPQTGASIDMWANWKDSAAPSQAIVNVEGKCSTMQRKFGTATNGAYTTTLTGLPTTCQRYRFEFKDSTGNDGDVPANRLVLHWDKLRHRRFGLFSKSPPTCGCTLLRWQTVRRRRLRQRLRHLRGQLDLQRQQPVHSQLDRQPRRRWQWW